MRSDRGNVIGGCSPVGGQWGKHWKHAVGFKAGLALLYIKLE